MGVRSVTGAAAAIPDDSTNWKLDPGVAKDVQGLIVSGFNDLPFAKALFLDIEKADGGWLDSLDNACPITSCDGPHGREAILAFTISGLKRIGLKEALKTFLQPFQEGMLQADRRRRLGDDDPNHDKPAVLWSGNTDVQNANPGQATQLTVHALLLIYEKDAGAFGDRTKAVTKALKKSRVATVREIELDLNKDPAGLTHEHFGFADGISQPIPFGRGTLGPNPRDPLHGVPMGEILLGYDNAHGEVPPGPLAVDTAGPYDLGLNGAYLVVRELQQDVAGFWNSLDREAAALGAGTMSAEDLAARIVGRDLDGNLLRPGGTLPPINGQPDNDSVFFKEDRHGFGCPLGSHIRRANPRDGLSPGPNNCADLLQAANNHRILRRGRKYGPRVEAADRRTASNEDRGLLFICVNTDIERQFEFVQQNWVLNPNFATLFAETDPLVGPKGPMTLPQQPLRAKVKVDTYVNFVGGEYFFLPSLTTLTYFKALASSAKNSTPTGG